MKTCYLIFFLFITSIAGIKHSFAQESQPDSIVLAEYIFYRVIGNITNLHENIISEQVIYLLKNNDTVSTEYSDTLGAFFVDISDTGNFRLCFSNNCNVTLHISTSDGNFPKTRATTDCDSTKIKYKILAIEELPPARNSRRYYKGLGDINKTITSDEIEKGAY